MFCGEEEYGLGSQYDMRNSIFLLVCGIGKKVRWLAAFYVLVHIGISLMIVQVEYAYFGTRRDEL